MYFIWLYKGGIKQYLANNLRAYLFKGKNKLQVAANYASVFMARCFHLKKIKSNRNST